MRSSGKLSSDDAAPLLVAAAQTNVGGEQESTAASYETFFPASTAPWTYRYCPTTREERGLLLRDAPDDKCTPTSYLVLRKGSVVTVSETYHKGMWVYVQWTGRDYGGREGGSGWTRAVLPSGETVLKRVNSYRRFQAWRGAELFFFDGRVMLGPNIEIFLFTNVAITLPVWVCIYFVCPTFPAHLRGLLAGTAGTLWAISLSLLWATALTEPGIIPRNLGRIVPEDPPQGSRLCETCNVWRPPRGKHCRQCDHCVEHFDHHCPWTASCIGGRNYRYFFSFLVFISTTTAYLLVLCWLRLGSSGRERAEMLGLGEKRGAILIEAVVAEPLLAMTLIFGGVTFLSLVNLLGYHILITCVGQTTNERVLGVFRRRPNPYNQGCLGNYGSAFFSEIPPSNLLDMSEELSGEGGVEGWDHNAAAAVSQEEGGGGVNPDALPSIKNERSASLQSAIPSDVDSGGGEAMAIEEPGADADNIDDSIASSLTDDDPSLQV